MVGALSPAHWVIILAVLVLLFGAKRLPELARGLGQSMKIIRAETNTDDRDRTAQRESADD